jgi:hypothetical protein
MSMSPHDLGAIPEETARIAQAAFRKGTYACCNTTSSWLIGRIDCTIELEGTSRGERANGSLRIPVDLHVPDRRRSSPCHPQPYGTLAPAG